MRRGSTLAIPSRASLSLVCLAAACTGPAGPTETPKTTRLPAAESAEPERSESARIVARSEDVEPAEVFDSATGERSYRIRYRFSPEKKLYYIIENEFRDRGGVPDFGLTFVTSVKDRRTVIQSVARGTPADERKHGGESVNLTWVFDRYEVTERGMKEKISFDSLRESAPKKKLLPLGTIAGSNASFLFNSRTGEASECVITPARLPETGADLNPLKRVAGRPRLSRTAQRCALTSKNLNRLLDDLGPLFLPNALKRVGEEWTNQRVEDVRSIGRVITDYTFRLTDVWEDGGRKIARIEVSGAASLAKASSNDAAAQLQSPRGSRRQPRRDFTIDRQVCRGTIDFDLTAGEMIEVQLLRELDVSAKLKSEKKGDMRLETGSSHLLRVQVTHTPPPKPVIVGGPKGPAPAPGDAPGELGAHRKWPKKPLDPLTASQLRDIARRTATQQKGKSGRPANVRPSGVKAKVKTKTKTPPAARAKSARRAPATGLEKAVLRRNAAARNSGSPPGAGQPTTKPTEPAGDSGKNR